MKKYEKISWDHKYNAQKAAAAAAETMTPKTEDYPLTAWDMAYRARKASKEQQ